MARTYVIFLLYGELRLGFGPLETFEISCKVYVHTTSALSLCLSESTVVVSCKVCILIFSCDCICQLIFFTICPLQHVLPKVEGSHKVSAFWGD